MKRYLLLSLSIVAMLSAPCFAHHPHHRPRIYIGYPRAVVVVRPAPRVVVVKPAPRPTVVIVKPAKPSPAEMRAWAETHGYEKTPPE